MPFSRINMVDWSKSLRTDLPGLRGRLDDNGQGPVMNLRLSSKSQKCTAAVSAKTTVSII